MDIQFNDDEIDVKEIMKQIKQNISKKEYKDDILHKADDLTINSNSTELENLQFILNSLWHNTADSPITSHRKVTGKLIVFAKKVLRKCLRWYMNPVVERQVEFNAHIVRTVNELVNQSQLVEQYQMKLLDLNNQIKDQTKQIAMNRENLKNMEEGLRCIPQITAAEQVDEIPITIEGIVENTNLVKNQTANIEGIVNELKANIEDKEYALNQLEIFEQKLAELEVSIEDVTIERKQLYDRITEDIHEKEQLSAKIQEAAREREQLSKTIRISTERLKRIERKLNHYGMKIEEDSSMMLQQYTSGELSENNEASSQNLYDFDYYLFEEYYRGSREEIIQRQEQYLKYFGKTGRVLDLGCGRGEFTELLIQNGIEVTAVDLNEDMVSYCQERGFPIVKQDILTYLMSVPDNSLGGIFLGQVIEHLTPDQLFQLVNISFNKLKPSAYFIAETPNPQCLSVFAQSFYMDMTHIKPVHPYTAKFLLESVGFNNVELQYLSANDDALKLPELIANNDEIGNLKQFNETIKHWNNIFFGYQDFYVAGHK